MATKPVLTGTIKKPVPGESSARFPGTPRVPTSRRAMPRPVQGYAGHTRLRDPKGRYVQGGSGIAFFGIEAMSENIARAAASFKSSAVRGAERVAQQMEQYAQENAPWEDRTGNARRTLKAVVVEDQNSATIYLGYNVFYGIFLEFANGGRYAIIQPTLLVFAPKVMGEIRNTISFNSDAGVHVPLRGFTP
jgi:hypothetical protein